MPDMIPVKIRPLSGEAFRPYGQVLERGALIYPDTDDGRVAMEMLRVRRRPHPNQIAQLAIHSWPASANSGVHRAEAGAV